MGLPQRRENTFLPAFPHKVAPIKPADITLPLTMLVKDPAAGWAALRANTDTFEKLFERYVYYLAAIPAVAGYFGFCIFDSGDKVRGIALAVSTYILSVVFMYGATILAQRTVGIFDGHM